MNCMIHHERAAVNTCKFCNGGLCPDCVAKKLTFENSMVCESCFIENGHNYIAELEQEQIKQKKIKRNLSIIFIIGLVLGISILVQGISRTGIDSSILFSSFSQAAFIWGFHIFFDGTFSNRILREKSMQDQMRDGIMEAHMMRDGSIFIYWLTKILLTIAIFWFRGLLFPIFYTIRIFGKDSKRIQDNISYAKEQMDSVIQHGDLNKQHNKD